MNPLSTSIHLLLLSGDPETSRHIRRKLDAMKQITCSVAEAADREAALESLCDYPADLALVIHQRDSGESLAFIRKARLLRPRLAIVLLGEAASPHLDLDAIDSGADDYVSFHDLHPDLLERCFRYAVSRRRALMQIHRSERRVRGILSSIPDMIFQIDARGIVRFYHSQKLDTIPLLPEDIVNNPVEDVFPRETAEQIRRCISVAFRTGSLQLFEFPLDSGTKTRVCEARMVACGDEEVLLVVRDITDLSRAIAQLEHRATHDPLTNLPNRALLLAWLQSHLDVHQPRARTLGLIYFDLDDFKNVNDSAGHLVGDKVLTLIASTLLRFRTEDVMVARVAGDEFAIAVHSRTGDTEQIRRIAGQVQKILSAPFELGGTTLYLTASAGLVISDGQYENAEDMFRDADIAMYCAKEDGKDCARHFNIEMHSTALRRFEIQNGLQQALQTGGFRLAFQPILNAKTRRLHSLEVLLRWTTPSGMDISPGVFIPIAERCGLIGRIEEWVLENAVGQWIELRRAGVIGTDVRLNINLSPWHLVRYNKAAQLLERFAARRVPLHLIRLEVTENAFIASFDSVCREIEVLQAAGISVHLDDFGTGYSSLAYLNRMPVNGLKIDRSFVRDLQAEGRTMAIMRAVVSLADELGMEITAEGIETHQQYALCRSMGVNYIQGYFTGRPMSAETLREFDVLDALPCPAQNGTAVPTP